MNIQQLEYIIAVDNYRHFSRAAEASFVTQPTLSMMIQKLEEELGVKIFDRTKLPIQPTSIGRKVIDQARMAVAQINQIHELILEEKGVVKGVFRLGIIPTVSPYLLPKLLDVHSRAQSNVRIDVQELTTENILKGITNDSLDGGILATPLNDTAFTEHPLYYERFYAYVSRKLPLMKMIFQPRSYGCWMRCTVSERRYCICVTSKTSAIRKLSSTSKRGVSIH